MGGHGWKRVLSISHHRVGASPNGQKNATAGSKLGITAGDALRATLLNVLIIHEKRNVWDLGAKTFPVLFLTPAGATELQCTDVYKYDMVQIITVQLGTKRAPKFESAVMRSYVLGLVWTEVNMQQLRDPLKVLVAHERRKEWDPGVRTTVSSTLTGEILGFLQTSILPKKWYFSTQ
jgi:hypothetical protein